MTCDEAEVLIHALIDGELDAGHARDVEAHVAGCARCAARFSAWRDLRDAMPVRGLRHAAPASLRSRIERAVPSPAKTDRRALLKGFVAGGALSALDGVTPERLNVGGLLARVKQGVDEVILAMNATVEGQTTAHYLTDQLSDFDVKVTRLAHGVPVGGELDYLDEGTLAAALKSRTAF